jgi:hypothetical protein
MEYLSKHVTIFYHRKSKTSVGLTFCGVVSRHKPVKTSMALVVSPTTAVVEEMRRKPYIEDATLCCLIRAIAYLSGLDR